MAIFRRVRPQERILRERGDGFLSASVTSIVSFPKLKIRSDRCLFLLVVVYVFFTALTSSGSRSGSRSVYNWTLILRLCGKCDVTNRCQQ